MDNTNQSKIETQLPENDKKKNLFGFLFLLPVIIVFVIFILYPTLRTTYMSFTAFNNLEAPVFIGLDNYRRLLFEDEIFKIAIRNIMLFTFFSTILAFGLSFLLAWVTSHMHRVLKMIISIMLCWISVVNLMPYGLARLFSSDTYGYANSFLMKIGIITNPVLFTLNPSYFPFISVLMSVLIGLGPLYLLIALGFNDRKKLKFYTHLAASLQIIISIVTFYPVISLVGFPSANYAAHTIVAHTIDYMMTRFEIGNGSAMSIINFILLILFLIIFNALLWGIFALKKFLNENNKKNKIQMTENPGISAVKKIFSVLLFLAIMGNAIILLTPFILSLLDSFKPLNELFMFPPRLFPLRPTLQNYSNMLKVIQFQDVVGNSILVYALSTIFLFLIGLFTGVGLSFFSFKRRKMLLYALAFSFVLSPLVLLPSRANNDVIFYAINSILPVMFGSISFGLFLYFSAIFVGRSMEGVSNPSEFIKSGKIISVIPGLFAISLLGALTNWFDLVYLPPSLADTEYTLVQSAWIMSYSDIGRAGISSSLHVLSLILPLVIVLLAVPFLLKKYEKD